MREKQIREEIWKIIDKEIRRRFGIHALSCDRVMTNIRIKTDKLLEKEQAVLVYQP